jgi:WD40 repeat protein
MDTIEAPQIFEHYTNNLNFTPYDTKWLPYSSKAVVIGQTPKMEGVIKFFKLEKEGLKEIFNQNFGKGLKTCAWNYYNNCESPQLAIGDISGKLFIFDLEKEKVNYSVQAHSQIINSLDTVGGIIGEGAIEIVTGSRDGKVKLWDPRQSDNVLCLEPDNKENVNPDCWCVSFGNNENHVERVIASGYDNGDLKLFDLKTNKLIMDENLKNGVCGLQFDRKDIKMNKLACTTLEGNCHLYDLRTFHPIKGFSSMCEKVSDSTIWGVRHSPFNRDLFVTMNGDGKLKLFKYNYPAQRKVKDMDGNEMGVCGSLQLLNDKTIAEQPIVGFDFNNDKNGLGISCALDQKLKVVIFTKLNLY